MSGSGISWGICKSAPCFRQTTTPAPHHSVFFTERMPFLPPNQQRQITEGNLCYNGSHPLNFSKVRKASRARQKRLVGRILARRPYVGHPWFKYALTCVFCVYYYIEQHCANRYVLCNCQRKERIHIKAHCFVLECLRWVWWWSAWWHYRQFQRSWNWVWCHVRLLSWICLLVWVKFSIFYIIFIH